MSRDSMLMCLIAFVLGFLVSHMMRGNGLSVCGKDNVERALDQERHDRIKHPNDKVLLGIDREKVKYEEQKQRRRRRRQKKQHEIHHGKHHGKHHERHDKMKKRKHEKLESVQLSDSQSRDHICNDICKGVEIYRKKGYLGNLLEIDSLNDIDTKCAFIDYGRIDITKNNLENKDLTCATISNTSASGLNLKNASLNYVKINRTDLTGANLSGADLSGADLKYAYLGNTDLTEANLSGADLSYGTLERANLTRANLNGAILTQTNIDGVNFDSKNRNNFTSIDRRANIMNANLGDSLPIIDNVNNVKNLNGAQCNENTTFPKNTTIPTNEYECIPTPLYKDIMTVNGK